MQPWDVTSGTGVDGFDRDCPGPKGGGGGRDDAENEGENGNAFNFTEDGTGGNTAATSAEGAFTIDIDVKEDNVHADLDGDGIPNEEEGANDEGGPRDSDGDGIPDYLQGSGNIIYWGNGECYYLYGFFGPCVTTPGTMSVSGPVVMGGFSGSASTSLNTQALAADACEGTFTVTNTTDSEINYAVVGRGSIQPSANGRGRLSTGESVDVTMVYPYSGDTLYPAIEDIGVFDEATNPAGLMALVYAEPNESCTGDGQLEAPAKVIRLNSAISETYPGGSEGLVYEFAARENALINIALRDPTGTGTYDPNNPMTFSANIVTPSGEIVRLFSNSANKHLARVIETTEEGAYKIQIFNSAAEDQDFQLGIAEIDAPRPIGTEPRNLTGTLDHFGDIELYELSVTGEADDTGAEFISFLPEENPDVFSLLYPADFYTPEYAETVGNDRDPRVNTPLFLRYGFTSNTYYIYAQHAGAETFETPLTYNMTIESPRTEPLLGNRLYQGPVERPPNYENVLFEFEATEGEIYNAAIVGSSRVSLALYNPEGVRVSSGEISRLSQQALGDSSEFDSISESKAFIASAGKYLLTYSYSDPDKYALALTQVPPLLPIDRSLNQITNTFSFPGEYRYYKYTAEAGDTVKLNIDTSAAPENFTLQVQGYSVETGNYIRNTEGNALRWINASEKTFSDTLSFPEAGDYYLYFHNGGPVYSGGYEGSFSFTFE